MEGNIWEEEAMEMEGRENRTEELTMQQHLTWYSCSFKHAWVKRQHAFEFECVCVVSTNTALDLWRGGDGVLRVGRVQIV